MSETTTRNLSEAADLYDVLDNERRAAVMVYLLYELTVSFRGINYDLLQGPEIQTASRLQKRLAGINEIQHQIADRFVTYFDKREGGKLDKDFFTALLKMAGAHDIPASVENALLKALNRYR
jgi:hypothetical protein